MDADVTTTAAGPAGARVLVEGLAQSKIREVANAGMGLEGVIPLWYGEPEAPTPKFITDAAAEALAQGCTFYTQNLGIDPLRETLAEYMSGLYAKPVPMERIAVTASGMASINLIQQILVDPGDNVVVTGPIWPNLVEAVRTMGGEVRYAQIRFGNDGWQLTPERIFELVDGRTRAIMVNSPNNPTGWVMERSDQQAVLDFARERGIWVVADEVYARLIYDRPVAPSFVDIAEPEDRVIVVNSFSKSWCMTGWRLGWVTAPLSLMDTLEKMIEFHYSCPAHFSQVAAITAVRDGETFVADMVARYKRARDLVSDRLGGLSRVRLHRPSGAFYVFFALEGLTDSLGTCQEIVRRSRVGLAPGSAFGPEGEGYIRLCFANTEERLAEALDRLEPLFEEGL